MSIADDPMPDLVRTLRSPTPGHPGEGGPLPGQAGVAGPGRPAATGRAPSPTPTARSARRPPRRSGRWGRTPCRSWSRCSATRTSTSAATPSGRWASSARWPRRRCRTCASAMKDADPRTAAGAAQALGNIGDEAAETIPPLTEAMRRHEHRAVPAGGQGAQPDRPAGPAGAARPPEAPRPVRPRGGGPGPGVDGAGRGLRRADADRGRCGRPGWSRGCRTRPRCRCRRRPRRRRSATPAQVGPTPEETSRVYAAQALGRIGSNTAAVVAALTQASEDANDQVRHAARAALKQIQGA